MKRRLVFIGLGFCLLTLFSRCADQDMLLPDNGKTAGLTNAVFQLSIDFDRANGMTRTDDGTQTNDSTPGHSIERAIHSVHLFVVPVRTSGGNEEERWDEMKYGVARLSGTFNNPIQVPVAEIPSTKMHIYVGANLSEAQVNAFRNNTNLVPAEREYATQEKLYKNAINEFAPFDTDGVTRNRNPKNIAMFANEVLTVDVDADAESGDTSGDDGADEKNSINIGTVYLKRMVAKVLVTCATQKGSEQGNESEGFAPGGLPTVEYVKLTDEFTTNEGAKPKGWIRQEQVYYFVNNMPRGTRFLQTYRVDEQDNTKKTLVPNYNLKTSMEKLGTKFSPLDFIKDNVNRIFIHYDQLELYKNNSSFKVSSVWDQKTYDDLIKVGGPTTDNAYNQDGIGMYTLENVFDTEGITQSEMNQLMEYAAVPMVTQVSIAACFTPRFIYVTKEEWEKIKDEKFKEESSEEVKKVSDYVTLSEVADAQGGDFWYVECENEKVAQTILTASLKIHGRLTDNDGNDEYDTNTSGEKDRYPINTYFVYSGTNEASFNTYGTASKGYIKDGKDNVAIWPEMVPFTRGWGYYYTYINNVGNGPVDNLSQSCIERNCYYILTVNSIGHMGASVTDPKYIKVYTRKADWKEGGTGETTLH